MFCLMRGFVIVITLSMLGCTSGGASRRDMNTKISISYATVLGFEQIKLESQAGKSAAIGGLWGLLGNSRGNSGDMIAGAAIGAVLMGGTAKIAEGSSVAYSYTLKGLDGQVYKVMIDHDSIAEGDCVSVEQGQNLTIRRVASNYCAAAAPDPVQSQLPVGEDALKRAAACEAARQGLLDAPDEEINAWAKKVRMLCEDGAR